MGGYKFTFDGPFSTPTSYLTTSKIHWNSAILAPGTKYLVVEVKNFYLKNPMYKHEYYKIALILIPQDTISNYNLMYKKINGFLYVRVEKGMYGLVHAGIISHTALK